MAGCMIAASKSKGRRMSIADDILVVWMQLKTHTLHFFLNHGLTSRHCASERRENYHYSHSILMRCVYHQPGPAMQQQ